MWYDATSAAGTLEDPKRQHGRRQGRLRVRAGEQDAESSGWLWAWALAMPKTHEEAGRRLEVHLLGDRQGVREAGRREAGLVAGAVRQARKSTYEIPEYKESAKAFADDHAEGDRGGRPDEPRRAAAAGAWACSSSASPSSPTSARRSSQEVSAAIAGQDHGRRRRWPTGRSSPRKWRRSTRSEARPPGRARALAPAAARRHRQRSEEPHDRRHRHPDAPRGTKPPSQRQQLKAQKRAMTPRSVASGGRRCCPRSSSRSSSPRCRSWSRSTCPPWTGTRCDPARRQRSSGWATTTHVLTDETGCASPLVNTVVMTASAVIFSMVLGVGLRDAAGPEVPRPRRRPHAADHAVPGDADGGRAAVEARGLQPGVRPDQRAGRIFGAEPTDWVSSVSRWRRSSPRWCGSGRRS